MINIFNFTISGQTITSNNGRAIQIAMNGPGNG